jgi:alpha-D-ribose 1-methylphosphonate 5-triphosphate synthase subunit PhnI
MYVAVKGGERAIENAHRLLAEKRRGDPDVPVLSLEQITEQLSFAVDRVMNEGSVYDRELAALAVKQAQGDLVEAAFLLRAYRTTLPRLAVTSPIDTSRIVIRRRISATFKDLPGGQILGPTFDYTHRLLDFDLDRPAGSRITEDPFREPTVSKLPMDTTMPRVVELLDREGLIEQGPMPEDPAGPGDVTREPLTLPCDRDVRLQCLARADEGFLLALGYSSQRGFGATHPFVGEIRMGEVTVVVEPRELGFPVEIGEITVTECEMVSQFKGSKDRPPQFTRGYGLTFGCCERKAMAMSVVDRSLRARELDEEIKAPAEDEEFVLTHGDNVEAAGFLQHLKLPHHVDFQADLVMVRQMRAEMDGRSVTGEMETETETRTGTETEAGDS